MAGPSSARHLGDMAQDYLFWMRGGLMLAGHGIREVGYETGEFKAFDDVGVKFSEPRPDGLGGIVDEEHIQTKFSVAGGKTVTGEALAEPELINATKTSLLQRLRDAVDNASSKGRHCRFVLWSPWPVEQKSLLDKMLDKGQGALRLDRLFDGKTAKSESGKLRELWAKDLGIGVDDRNEFQRILTPFRIEHDSRTLDRIRSEVSNILPMGGLKTIPDWHRASAYPNLIQRLSQEGLKWFDTKSLIEACKQDGLWVGCPEPQSTATNLGVRTFMRFAESMEDSVSEILCLTEFFLDRHIRDFGLWANEVLPKLQSFLGRQLKSNGHYSLHIAAVASVAFAAGFLAEPKLGARFDIVQGGVQGTQIWSCRMDGPARPVNWLDQQIDLNSAGDELAVAISVSNPCADDARAFTESQLPSVRKLISLCLPSVGLNSLIDGGHAFRAANEAVHVIDQVRRTSGPFSKVHLFWSAPNTFAFMLGQLARPLGRISLYEFDFEGTGVGRYQPSLELTPSIRLG